MEWVARNPKRFLHERLEFERLSAEVEWLKAVVWQVREGLAIEVDFDLLIHGRVYAGTLTYPDVFPETPPYIRSRDSSEVWSQHQYGPGGSLCLEWRADNWHPSVTGAELVRSAFKLIDAERHPTVPAQVPSAHQVTRGQEMRGSHYRLVATPLLLDALKALPSATARRVRTQTLLHRSSQNLTNVSVISAFENSELAMADITDLPAGVTRSMPLFAWKGDGFVVKSDIFDRELTLSSIEALLEVIEATGLSSMVSLDRDPTSTKFKDTLLVGIGSDVESVRVFGIDSGELHEYEILLPEAAGSRLPAENAALENIRICIVGLGSVGSKVAVSLARSGARKFLLVDDDILLPKNLCRHELSWSSVGIHKAEALREALSLIAPGIDANARIHRFAGQESAISAATVLKEIASCELIIDASANSKVLVRLAAIAKRHRRALCWGEVFAGGMGGLIARARPDVDPNPLAVRDAINQHFAQLPPAPFRHATGYDVESEEPLIGDDSDVTHISSALTRLALDAALRRTPSLFPAAAYIIGLRCEWVFTQPFDTQPIVVSGAGWEEDEEWSGTAEEREEAVNIVLGILTGAKHDQTDSSAASAGDNSSSPS